ncbi:14 kDa phosphohistidine phosphatase isoform X1 [Lepisosteus oculatus]|uniref:14 kDa phosphohistidine phosphatase isoform X1 n=1 Tax=Lepisosteus oculatus TaxID=7918 RepID=UPI00371CC36F
MAAARLAAIPEADIDADGVFKYVLIRVHTTEEGDDTPSKDIVRGYAWAEYHESLQVLGTPISSLGAHCVSCSCRQRTSTTACPRRSSGGAGWTASVWAEAGFGTTARPRGSTSTDTPWASDEPITQWPRRS